MFDLLFGLSLIEKAELVIAETAIGISEWETLGAKESKIRLQHPLLDTSEFYRLPEKHEGTPFTILFLGRLHQAKGIDILLDAFAKLVRVRSAKLLIAGQDDGYLMTLKAMVNDAGLQDRVCFTGFLDKQDKLSALVDADVLIQPSRNEAGARPSLEAIMCHTPVIVSRDTGAGEEIASFDGGLLFDTGNAEDLAMKITQVMDNPEDAKVRTEKAREYIVENLSLENGIVGYERLYREAVR
jgi:glycosyltransferase involved in cell wall biosynthesis